MKKRQKSKATKSDVQWYTQGECHILAVALHRHLGWPMLVIRETEGLDERTGRQRDASTCDVHHVYAVSPDGYAWDIRGAIPLERVKQDVRTYFDIKEWTQDLCSKEKDLKNYVHESHMPHDHTARALVAYSDEDVDNSWDVAKLVFNGIEAFEIEASIKKPRKRARPA